MLKKQTQRLLKSSKTFLRRASIDLTSNLNLDNLNLDNISPALMKEAQNNPQAILKKIKSM